MMRWSSLAFAIRMVSHSMLVVCIHQRAVEIKMTMQNQTVLAWTLQECISLGTLINCNDWLIGNKWLKHKEVLKYYANSREDHLIKLNWNYCLCNVRHKQITVIGI